MKQIVPLIFVMMSCILPACDYSPSGDHFEEINPKPEITANITLNQQQDTIEVRGGLNLHYSISIPGREFYGYKLKLDGQVLLEGSALSDSYYFRSEDYKDGYHTLQLLAVANAGTGSLADKVGAEVLQVYSTWVLHIDNSVPGPVPFTIIKPENGRLKVEWQPHTKKGFRKFVLYKTFGNYSQQVATFTDPKATSWIDETYVGGPVYYALEAHTEIDYPEAHSSFIEYNYPLSRVLHTAYNEANDLLITFSSTPFYANFGEYEVKVDDVLYKTSGRTDTVVTVPDLGFGSDFEVKVFAYPKSYDPNLYRYTYTLSTVKGYGAAWGPYPFQNLIMRPLADQFYAYEEGNFKVIDAATLQVKHQRATGWEHNSSAISEDGRYAYAVIGDVVHQLNPTTLQTLETYQLRDLQLFQTPYGSFTVESVSNTNRLVVALPNMGYTDSVYVVDMDRKKVLTKKINHFPPGQALISPNGKALRNAGFFFTEQPDGSWQPQPLPTSEVDYLLFHPTKPWYGVKRGLEFAFYAIATGALQKTITAETELYDYAVDAGSGYLYGRGAPHSIYVYNTDTGQLVRKVKLATSDEVFLFKDRVFSKDRYIPL